MPGKGNHVSQSNHARPSGPSSASTMVMRALIRRCPWCGGAGIFESWFRLKNGCPTCGFDFEREPGWYIGGMIVNTGASMILFSAILIGGLVLFSPDVPWTALSIVSISAMVIFPIVFYPISKTVWLAVDLLMTQKDPSVRK